jgi:predicted porin
VFETAIKSTGSATSFVGGNNGSELTFGVSEDLGSGLKAMASQTFAFSVVANGVAAAQGGPVTAGAAAASSSPVGSYNSYVGLSSADAGSLKIGQQFSTLFFAAMTADPFNRGLGGSTAGGAQAQVANSVTYASPSISGVSLSYQQTVDNTVASYINYSISYNAGALSAAYASGKTGATTENVIGASYDFGMAKLYAGSATSTGKKTASIFGVSAPFGPISVAASTSTDNAGATQATYGLTYNFSKRTSAYLTNTDTSTTAPFNYVGIRHNF